MLSAKEWIALLTQGGAIVVMAAWIFYQRQAWLEEREDRRKLQSERDALLERTLKALSDSNIALRALVDSQGMMNTVVTSLKDLMISGRSKE